MVPLRAVREYSQVHDMIRRGGAIAKASQKPKDVYNLHAPVTYQELKSYKYLLLSSSITVFFHNKLLTQ